MEPVTTMGIPATESGSMGTPVGLVIPEVREALESPEEIRRSKSDPEVYLFYKARASRRWVCAVSKREGDSGFLITAYPTDAIKEGERIWPK